MMSRQAAPNRGSSGGAPLNRRSMRHRIMAIGGAGVLAAGIAVPVSAAAKAPVAQVSRPHVTQTSTISKGNFDGLGIAPGKIKHVWLIILENKSYDATFTGLNNNTYLWKTLPSQGVLLKNYYGTGHDSLDNYISMVSGQAPMTDDQSDCPDYDAITGSVDYSGNLDSNTNYGQLVSAAGPNARPAQNGCVYPASVPTLFNQLDAARRELEGVRAGSRATPTRSGSDRTTPARQYCGAPYASPGPTGEHGPAEPRLGQLDRPVRAQALPVPVVRVDPAVRRLQRGPHREPVRPRPTASTTTCRARATTPAFSWITPNNCSDGHDAVCHGNNLSGGFSDPNTPNAAGQLHRRAVRRRPVPASTSFPRSRPRRRTRTAA